MSAAISQQPGESKPARHFNPVGVTRTAGSWKPGQSGNPRGRAPPPVDIAELARKHGPKAIEIVAGLMLNDKDSKVRLAAAVALLDRGFGRPKQELDVNSNSTIELHLVAARAISSALLERQQTPQMQTIEATSTDIPTE